MGFIDEVLQIIRSASTNNIKELRVRQLAQKDSDGGHWVVDLVAPWETGIEICERLDISQSKLRRRWKRRPTGSGRSEVGPTGRIIHRQSDPQLDKFLKGATRLGPITPEQIVRVTIEVASHGIKAIKKLSSKKRSRKRHKSHG